MPTGIKKHLSLLLVCLAALGGSSPSDAGVDKHEKHEKQAQKAKQNQKHHQYEVLNRERQPAYPPQKGKHDKALPHGLEKKVARGKPLPPGWQKKLSRGDVLDNALFSRGKIVSPIDDDGNILINIEKTQIKIHHKTRKIIDIIKN